jgi:chlorobactene glucosyltransferase
MEIILFYQFSIVLILIIILINFIVNNHLFRNTVIYSLPAKIKNDPPKVSILIPARNEERNINRCLRSLTRQDYPNFEIIVLDDNSSDNTRKVVRKMAEKDSRIKLVKGNKLEKGWLGKSYACWQLSRYASGQYLLFTDADTLHFKNSLSCAIAALLVNKVDALSIFARQITVTFHERMMVPFGNFFVLSFLPLTLMRRSKSPLFCTAIGQFMLFKRQVYENIGGHQSVKKEILEDVHISKQVKKCGYKFMIFDGRDNFYCRMYHNFDEVVRGYAKILAAAFDYSIFMQGFVTIMVFLLFLAPFISLPLGIFIFDWPQIIINAICAQIIILLALRVMLTIRFKHRFIDIFLQPVSVIYLILISLYSALISKLSAGVYWKGRSYDVRNEDELKLIKDKFISG